MAGNNSITIIFRTTSYERIRIYTPRLRHCSILIAQDTPITRINASLLTRSIGSLVSIVGTVETVSGNMATLHSSVIVTPISFTFRMTNLFAFSLLAVSPTPLGNLSLSFSHRRVVEVIGTVNNDGSITMQYATGFDGTYSKPTSLRLL